MSWRPARSEGRSFQQPIPSITQVCNRCDRPAQIECAECFSFFCLDCSQQVHSVGKWKNHTLKFCEDDNAVTSPPISQPSATIIPPFSVPHSIYNSVPSFPANSATPPIPPPKPNRSGTMLVRSSSGGANPSPTPFNGSLSMGSPPISKPSFNSQNLPPVPTPPISTISQRTFVKSPSQSNLGSNLPPNNLPPTPSPPVSSPSSNNPPNQFGSLRREPSASTLNNAQTPSPVSSPPPISRPSNPPISSVTNTLRREPSANALNPNQFVPNHNFAANPPTIRREPSVSASPTSPANQQVNLKAREPSNSAPGAPVGRGVGSISASMASQIIGGMGGRGPSPSSPFMRGSNEDMNNDRSGFVNGTIKRSDNKPPLEIGGPKRAPSMAVRNVNGVTDPVKPPPKTPHKIIKLNIKVGDGTLPNYGSTFELKFPSVASVGQLIQLIGRRLYGSFPPEKKEDRKGYPLLYLDNQLLDPEKIVGFYPQIAKGNPIEVRKVNHEAHIIQVTNEEQATSKRSVDETTSVWSVLIQPLKKLGSKLTGTPEEVTKYGLFFEGSSEPLQEDDFMLNHPTKLKTKLLFKKCSMVPNDDMRILILFKDQYSLGVSSAQTMHSILRRFAKISALKENLGNSDTNALRTPNLFEYAFQIPPEDETDYGVWMEDWDLLGSYHNRLKENQIVELKTRSKQFDIDLPDGSTYSLNVDSLTQVFDVLNLMVTNLPDLFPDAPEEYQLAIPGGGGVLSTERSLWSYNAQSLVVNRIAKPLIVFYNSKQVILTVDFSIPVIKLMMQMWIAFGINPKKEGEFSLRRMSPDIEIDLKRSLLQQSIGPNAAVSLRITQNENTEFITRNDVSIWSEETTPATCVMDEKVLAAGTLNQVVKQMTSETNPHPEFRQAALMTLASFTTPQALIIKLMERFNVPMPGESNFDEEIHKKRVAIQLQVGGALKAWLKHHPSDFDHEITQIVTHFCDTIPDYLSGLAIQIQNAIVERTCNMKSQNKSSTQPTMRNTSQKLNRTMSVSSYGGGMNTIYDQDEAEVAKQFCLIDSQFFNAILPKELVNQNWAKNQGVKAPNILKLIERMNAISNWVASEILEPARVKVRSLRFTHLIKIAEHLRSLNNYGTLMAFLGGFNCAAVSRLKFTKQLIPKKYQDTLMALETLMSVDNASKAYRTTLSLSSPPGIPYVGLHLIDLTFTDEGNPDYVTEHKLINMTKRILTFRIISEIDRFKYKPYLFLRVPAVESQIKDLPYYPDEKGVSALLYETSLSREPRGAEKVV
eukprot:TRINITY_DN3576_c0_g1_i1.p1 TRINITY_DN3576_c0_g1~~TRINITY_DN3576_c0_g1_i1.p1  ORF type:complete len:1270 (-),score=506.68 TRINITY_DN3576_c0_g1_i1:183-3992(-)